jgi:hypothetical protein
VLNCPEIADGVDVYRRAERAPARERDCTRIISQEPAGSGASAVHLLILLLQHLLGRLLNEPQLQPEIVRRCAKQPSAPQPGAQPANDETAEYRGCFDSYGWLTVLFATAALVSGALPVAAAPAPPSHDRLPPPRGRQARSAGGRASHRSSFLSSARRTTRLSPERRS